MEPRLKDKIALVTGSGRGIGEAIARRLAQEGAHVWIADIDEAAAQTVAARLAGATAARVDITDEESVAALAEAIGRKHGRLNILVNNAAILDTTSYEALTLDRFMEVQNINLAGALRVTKAMVPLMRNPPGVPESSISHR